MFQPRGPPLLYSTSSFNVVHLIGVEEHVYCAQMGRLRLFAIDEDAEKKARPGPDAKARLSSKS